MSAFPEPERKRRLAMLPILRAQARALGLDIGFQKFTVELRDGEPVSLRSSTERKMNRVEIDLCLIEEP